MNKLHFKNYLESIEVVKGIAFLENPSPMEFIGFFNNTEKKFSSRNDYLLRGLFYENSIYWFSAFQLTHFDAAVLMKFNYNLCERANAYRNSYGEIVLDYPEKIKNSGILRNFNIDDDGVLIV